MPFLGMNEGKKITEAKLENGDIVVYDACSEKPNAYDPKNFKSIGKGVIHSVNGVEQPLYTQTMYFYAKLF